jgi:adenylate cyclase
VIRRQIPFRVALVSIVVGLLVVTCGVLLGYGLSRGARNLETLKSAYLEQVAETSVREVARMPQIAAQVLRVQRYRIETGFYRLSDPMSVARAFAGALATDPDIRWVSYSEAGTGRFTGARRLQGDEFVLNLSDPRINRGVPREYHADSGDVFVRPQPATEPYEPRGRDWYRRGAAGAGSLVWTTPYTFTEGERGITAAMAVTDPRGRVHGVLTVDFSLAGLDSFLGRITLGRRGVVTLFDDTGELVAGREGPGREAAARAVQTSRLRPAAAASERAEVQIRAETWDVVARSIAVGPGLDWIVVAAVPDADFMGQVYATRRNAVAMLLVFVGIAVVVGFALANGIARALQRASGALDRAARFDPAAAPETRSLIREVAQLETAVGRVTASLRSFARYAPEEIVRDVVLQGREAMLSGERRDVTVLFSDLRGFTAFSERLRPEEVVAILNDHCELLVGIIARHHGFVVDFLGDAVFAVFNAPAHVADHVEHAVTCAIEIQCARAVRTKDHRARGWPPLEMGIGIDTGPAVVGNMGSLRRIKYGVVAPIVNSAARIETFTVGGQILISDAVRATLGERLVAEGPMEVEGKGLGAALRLWQVVALRGDTTLTMPAVVRDLVALPCPLDAGVRLFVGKQLDPVIHAARVHRLSAGGAELTTKAPLAVFSTVHVHLPALAATGGADVDGKIIAVGERDGVTTALVSFTGVGWDTRDKLEALARDAATTPA